MQKREFNTDKMIELQLSSTSKGNQRKWMADDIYVKECFYYQEQVPASWNRIRGS